MTEFIEWNYETRKAIRYERHGECNGCGQCCTSLIHLKVANDDKPNEARDGGTGTTEKGIWAEVVGQERFFQIEGISEIGKSSCPLLEDNRCMGHFDKANICKDWPMLPAHVTPFSECSYTFAEIERWGF